MQQTELIGFYWLINKNLKQTSINKKTAPLRQLCQQNGGFFMPNFILAVAIILAVALKTSPE